MSITGVVPGDGVVSIAGVVSVDCERDLVIELVDVALGEEAGEALPALDRLTAWCEAERLRRVAELRDQDRLGIIADTTLRTSHEVEALLRRASVVCEAPGFGQALHSGLVSPGHLDQLGHTLRRLDAAQRSALLDDGARLLAAAASSNATDFGRLLRREERRLGRVANISTLEEQQRSVRLRSRTDRDSGMCIFTLSLDPVRALGFDQRLQGATEALFHDRTPPQCPGDPLEKQAFLRAHALLGLLDGGGARLGPPEVIVVVDTTVSEGGPEVDWGLPVEIPARVLHDLWGRADVHAVVVRNGVVLHAPGTLDLGRTTRLANRAHVGHFAPCIAPVRFRAATPRSHVAPSTMWSGGVTGAPRICAICSRCAAVTITSCTKAAGSSRSAPTGPSPSADRMARCAPPVRPEGPPHEPVSDAIARYRRVTECTHR